MALYEFSLTSSGNDLTSTTAWKPLDGFLGFSSSNPGAVSSSPNLAPQGLCISCTSPTSTAAATFALAWVKYDTTNKIIRYNATGTIAATTRRTGLDGSSGDYVCDVTFNSTLNGIVDLQPYGEDQKVRVFLGLLTIGSGSSFDFSLSSMRAI